MKRTLLLLLTATLLASCATAPHRTCMDCPSKELVHNAIRYIATANGIDAAKLSYCVVGDNELIMEIDASSTIYVSTGFVSSFGDDMLLYCAIAHELAHYKMSHIAKQAGVALGTSVAFTVAGFFVPGLAYADHLVNPTVTSAYGRSHELDADAEAVRMCKTTGVLDTANRYIKMLERLDTLAPQDKSGFAAIWASHPPVADRIENIRKTFLLVEQP